MSLVQCFIKIFRQTIAQKKPFSETKRYIAAKQYRINGAVPAQKRRELQCGGDKKPYKDISCNRKSCQKLKKLHNPWKTWVDCPDIFEEKKPPICEVVVDTVGPGCMKYCEPKPKKKCQ